MKQNSQRGGGCRIRLWPQIFRTKTIRYHSLSSAPASAQHNSILECLHHTAALWSTSQAPHHAVIQYFQNFRSAITTTLGHAHIYPVDPIVTCSIDARLLYCVANNLLVVVVVVVIGCVCYQVSSIAHPHHPFGTGHHVQRLFQYITLALCSILHAICTTPHHCLPPSQKGWHFCRLLPAHPRLRFPVDGVCTQFGMLWQQTTMYKHRAAHLQHRRVACHKTSRDEACGWVRGKVLSSSDVLSPTHAPHLLAGVLPIGLWTVGLCLYLHHCDRYQVMPPVYLHRNDTHI